MKGKKETRGFDVGEEKAGGSVSSLGLGIECGRTHTKTMIYGLRTGEIVDSNSYPTSHDDPALCLEVVLDKVPDTLLREAQLVCLSLPFMLDVVREDKAGRACLILIGYPQDLPLNTYGARVIYLAGGHDVKGNEVRPLDEKGIHRAAYENRTAVDAFAVSSYFSIRNPDHETKACRIIEEETGKPVSSGHELCMHLDAVKRADTVALNALLVNPIQKTIASARTSLIRRAVDAPLMVVRGDGTLMGAEMASCRPVEAVLGTDSGTGMEKAIPATICHEEEATIRRRPYDVYQVYTSGGRYHFNSIEAATKKARSTAVQLATEYLIEAGACEIALEEEEEDFTTGDLGLVEEGKLVLERRLTVRARGLPRMGIKTPAVKAALRIQAGI